MRKFHVAITLLLRKKNERVVFLLFLAQHEESKGPSIVRESTNAYFREPCCSRRTTQPSSLTLFPVLFCRLAASSTTPNGVVVSLSVDWCDKAIAPGGPRNCELCGASSSTGGPRGKQAKTRAADTRESYSLHSRATASNTHTRAHSRKALAAITRFIWSFANAATKFQREFSQKCVIQNEPLKPAPVATET